MDDDEDDFATYGTALDPLDEENLPRKRPVTVEEQIAVDAQGRRRFHGAFTGGFSAGYFNTVGSRDGWRPQQFKSSRSSKSSNLIQRPEDFMDEEDTSEFGFAPSAIRATKEYCDESQKGTKRERTKQDSVGPIPGTPVLQEILKPIRERVGVTLLKKMGWKPGQGVGPRLTKKEKKQKQRHREKVKVYGCTLPNQEQKEIESETESSDDEYANITFAPDDYEPFRCNPKDNYYGIGYTGLERRPVLNQHINLFDAPAFSLQEKNKKLSIKGQAFGVGAFEVEDDDIYAKDDMSRYDFTLAPEKKNKSRWSKEKKSEATCLEGFVHAKEQLTGKKVFPAPAIPKDFVPVHKVKKSRFSPLPGQEIAQVRRLRMNAETRAQIINDDRPSIIDSKGPESKPTSVANKLIARALNLHGKEQVAERQRLQESIPKKTPMSWLDKLSSTTFVRGETIGTDPKIQGSIQDPSIFSQQSQETVTGDEVTLVKPSFADLDKQRRFEQYLKFSQSERQLKFSSIQPLSMTEWERDQEVQEFEKAAKLSETIVEPTKKEAKEGQKENNEELNLDVMSLNDRMMAAAKKKMFGDLTRSITEWKPVKLVCVRFNIAEPSVGVAEEGQKKKKFSIFDSLAWDDVSKFEKSTKIEYEIEPVPSTSSNFPRADAMQRDSNQIDEQRLLDTDSTSRSEKEKSFEDTYDKIFGKTADENDSNEIRHNEPAHDDDKKEEPTAKMNVQQKKDLYKSIFLSSSEESGSENEEPSSVDDEKVKIALIGKSAAERNVQRNDSPPKGIFAKLDLDSLLKRPEKDPPQKKTEPEVEGSSEIRKADEVGKVESASKCNKTSPDVEMVEDDPSSDIYGPALPDALPEPDNASKHRHVFTLSKKIDTDSGKVTDVWVEKSRDKKKSKKEKKKHKHKERSRSKSRKKSKKEKKH
ncbi:hypothetical protein QAD02_019956 [Eretmocerus hayati]|uniref:Uncharacterized protein n=1 Tax=Eretmocerus hayati TaxID=131215 RepID=A0ACC2PLJ1_9HYME|nr:hypothetical protein QAD02_019956 [Eretmocerus hayati]